MREDDFEVYLRNTNLSENTIASYKFAVKQYFGQFDTVTQKKLRDHKMWLIESYKPKTVNLRIRAINCYLDSIGKGEWKLQFVKVQQKAFLENVISEADYEYFKSCLKRDGELFWYFAVPLYGSHRGPGQRADPDQGGACTDRIYGSVFQRRKAEADLHTEAFSGGGAGLVGRKKPDQRLSFFKQAGTRITTRGVAGQLKVMALRYGIDPAVAYPHSFRHRFAKSFLERFNDLALLADLMGHESIETTRIYLRRTSTEQQAIVDRVVDW